MECLNIAEIIFLLNQTNNSGAMIKQPIISPIHHVTQTGPNELVDVNPPKIKLNTPMVALMVVLKTTAKNINFKASDSRLKATLKLNFFKRYAPVSASKVFPPAIPAATQNGSLVKRLATKAPINIPGQYSNPNNSKTANARPVGGQ